MASKPSPRQAVSSWRWTLALAQVAAILSGADLRHHAHPCAVRGAALAAEWTLAQPPGAGLDGGVTDLMSKPLSRGTSWSYAVMVGTLTGRRPPNHTVRKARVVVWRGTLGRPHANSNAVVDTLLSPAWKRRSITITGTGRAMTPIERQQRFYATSSSDIAIHVRGARGDHLSAP